VEFQHVQWISAVDRIRGWCPLETIRDCVTRRRHRIVFAKLADWRKSGRNCQRIFWISNTTEFAMRPWCTTFHSPSIAARTLLPR